MFQLSYHVVFVVELLKKETILGKTGQVASLERDLALLAEEPWTVITLSSIYGNTLQYCIFEYTFFFGMTQGRFGGAAEAFEGAAPAALCYTATRWQYLTVVD